MSAEAISATTLNKENAAGGYWLAASASHFASGVTRGLTLEAAHLDFDSSGMNYYRMAYGVVQASADCVLMRLGVKATLVHAVASVTAVSFFAASGVQKIIRGTTQGDALTLARGIAEAATGVAVITGYSIRFYESLPEPVKLKIPVLCLLVNKTRQTANIFMQTGSHLAIGAGLIQLDPLMFLGAALRVKGNREARRVSQREINELRAGKQRA